MRKFRNSFAAVAAAAMTGVMAFGLVATAAPVVSVYAEGQYDSSSTTASTTAIVDYKNMILEVTSSDSYFTVDVLKSESDKEKPSKSYTYAGGTGTVKIDLGFLKIKKENILNIYGCSQDKTKGSIVKVAAQPTKEKFTVDATQNSLVKALGMTDEKAALYEWRSSFGNNWGELGDFNFDSAKVAGTTIVVRLAAVNEKGDTDAPAGPEAKIKIPAAPKAPKVTVDYVKDSVKVTDKMQIALLGTTPVDEKTGWVDASKGMSRSDIVTALKIADNKAAEAFSIVVRTSANGKKSASVPVIVPIKATAVLAGDPSDAATATVTIDGAASTIKADKTDNGVIFTITGNAAFQYDKGGNKWTNIASGKEIKISASTIKVRIAPEKEDKKTADSGEFASNVVTLTPAVKETPGDTTPGEDE